MKSRIESRVPNVNHPMQFASGLPRLTGFMLGVAIIGIQACGGDGTTGATAPTSKGTFTLSAAPSTVPVLQGGSGESTITIVRSGGFTGSVALAVTGAPAGLTATITPSTTSGTTATMVLTTVAAVVAGSATLTITGTAAGRTDQTTTATVAITPNTGGAGNVTIDFSACPTAFKPTWFASQNGDGAWTQILDSADVYRFNVASEKGGYAFVSQGEWTTIIVSLGTQAELVASPISQCEWALAGPKRISGTITGLGAGDVAYLGLGGPNPNAEGGPLPSSFVLTGIQDGNQDLIAYRSNPSAFTPRERVIIRRDQNIADYGSLGAVDFDAPETFAPATATATVTGGFGAVGHFMSYYAGAGCSHYDLYDAPTSGVNFTMRGIPGAQQRATDFHGITVYASNPPRSVHETFHTLADRSIVLPAALPAPRITALPGAHARIQAALTLPAEYQTSLRLWAYFGARSRTTVDMTASLGWLGGLTATLAVPDFSRVTGWRSSFLPPADVPVGWSLAAYGGSIGGPCMENARFVSAYVSGGN